MNKKISLLSTVSFLAMFLLTSCITQEWYATTNNFKQLIPGLAVNGFGDIRVQGKDFSCSMNSALNKDYKDIIKDFEKAKEWDSVKKTASLKKSINTYHACSLSLNYVYELGEASTVRVCFQNPSYTTVVDINCIYFNDYDRVIAALNRAPTVMKQIKQEVDAANALK